MKITAQAVTLAIATKDRPHHLHRLLESIKKLTPQPRTILVIDNDAAKSARKLIRRWSAELPLIYAHCPQVGVPWVRNLALKTCSTRFLCFIDDDCVVKKNWLSVLLDELNFHQPGFILGACKLMNQNNYWARVQSNRYLDWVEQLTIGSRVLPPFFDTKNVCLDLEKIDLDQVKFDQIFAGLDTAGCEDIDFGLQLAKMGIKGRYLPAMVVWHEEVDRGWDLIKKTYQKGKLEGLLHRKWHMCHLGAKQPQDFWSRIFFWGMKSV